MARYEYETSPKKLEPVAKPKTTKKVESKSTKTTPKQKSVKKPAKKTKKKTNKRKLTLYICIGFAIVFTISYRHSLIMENFDKTQKLKRELSLMEQENEQLKVNIESNLNLKNIEQIARDELGMKRIADTEKVYITLPKKDYIETRTEEVKITEEKSLMEKFLEGIGL